MERRFDYRPLSIDGIIEHLSVFISNLWQIHVFEEGNTRTTAVFTIKYLRSLGFDVTNDTFAKNARYFRNALVRANYRNLAKGVFGDRSFLIKFLRNLLLNENNPLNNKDLHVRAIPSVEGVTREARILRMMKDDPYIKIEEMARNLSVSVRTVKNLIAALEKEGTVKRVGGKKLGHWEVA